MESREKLIDDLLDVKTKLNKLADERKSIGGEIKELTNREDKIIQLLREKS